MRKMNLTARPGRMRLGASMLEYVLMILLVGVLVTSGLKTFGGGLNNGLDGASSAVASSSDVAMANVPGGSGTQTAAAATQKSGFGDYVNGFSCKIKPPNFGINAEVKGVAVGVKANPAGDFSASLGPGSVSYDPQDKAWSTSAAYGPASVSYDWKNDEWTASASAGANACFGPCLGGSASENYNTSGERYETLEADLVLFSAECTNEPK